MGIHACYGHMSVDPRRSEQLKHCKGRHLLVSRQGGRRIKEWESNVSRHRSTNRDAASVQLRLTPTQAREKLLKHKTKQKNSIYNSILS